MDIPQETLGTKEVQTGRADTSQRVTGRHKCYSLWALEKLFVFWFFQREVLEQLKGVRKLEII